MTEGLITRIGKWIDSKWESKVTVSQLNECDAECRGRYVALTKELQDLRARIAANDYADLKIRFEKLELYLGMSRKVDPTKPAVAKSAFAM